MRRRGVSQCVSEYDLSETMKVSVLTSLSVGSPPVYVDMRSGDRANDAFDFLLLIVHLVQSGVLVQGDVLVLDNAPIHNVVSILHPLHTIITSAGITLWFLPTYSPELNPCEYVFAQSKKWLKCHRRMHLPFWYEIARGMAETTTQHMINCYNKSIWNP